VKEWNKTILGPRSCIGAAAFPRGYGMAGGVSQHAPHWLRCPISDKACRRRHLEQPHSTLVLAMRTTLRPVGLLPTVLTRDWELPKIRI
jgi:hypothetical protein